MPSPGTRKNPGKIILSQSISTPIGQMRACATEEGICLLEFEERPDLQKQLESLQSYFVSEIKPGNNDHFHLLQSQLNEYFNGDRKEFTMPLVMAGTGFQKRVWKELMEVLYGTTKTYLHLSKILGDVKAIRAVAAANGANKLAIVIPCHRIIGSDGKLTGYAGGLWRKQWLINHESKQYQLSF